MSSQKQPSQVPTTEPIITTSSPPLYETTIPYTTSSMSHDSPLSGGDTPRSDEGSNKLNELTELCIKLSDKVTSLEEDLKQTKNVYGKALTKLVKKVKYLEDKLNSTSVRRKARMVLSDDEEDLVSEDHSKQGRMAETKYEEVKYDLDYTDTFHAAKILTDASRERVKTYKRYTRRRSTVSSRDSTAGGLFSTAEEILTTDERMAQKLNEEEMAKALDEREETDHIDWSIVAEQVKERQSDTIKRYQTLKKKPVSVAQARKNMMIYLKNMAGYKMGYFEEEKDTTHYEKTKKRERQKRHYFSLRVSKVKDKIAEASRKGLSIVNYSYGFDAKQRQQVRRNRKMRQEDLVMKDLHKKPTRAKKLKCLEVDRP
ncbi:hypothetical protein Tco_0833986 [Tanacetum coccineum]